MAVDLSAVVRASRAIAGAVGLEQALETAARVVAEATAAQRVHVVVAPEDGPTTAASAAKGPRGVGAWVHPEASASRTALPWSLLDDVRRLRERIVLADTTEPHPFSDDAYLADGHPRSILGVPLAGPSGALGALALEDDRAPDAFPPDRVAVAELLASQVALAVESALLGARLRRAGAALAQTEQARRDCAARFDALASTAPVGILLTDADGRCDYANERWCRITGVGAGELVGARWDRSVHPDDVPGIVAAWQRAVETDTPFRAECRFLGPDGATTWVLGQAAVQRAADGRVTGYVAAATDITEQKHAEAALREREERYRALYTRTPVMMHSIDRDGRLVSVSDYWLRSLGYERSEVIGRRSVEFLTPASQRYARDVVLPAYFATGQCTDVPYQFVRRDGEVVDVLLSAIAERGADGTIERSLAVLIDVTERNRALRALGDSQRRHQESERRYRAIFEMAAVALREEDYSEVHALLADLRAQGVEDLRGHLEAHPEVVAAAAARVKVRDVNAEALKLYGARDKDALMATLAPAATDAFREALLALAAGARRFETEATVTTVHGQRRDTLMTVALSAADAPTASVLVSSLDITERKGLEEQLRHAQKMEAVGRLAGGIAHDFNNLLTVLIGQSELLLELVPSGDEPRAAVELIAATAARAATLTRQLLAFSRRQALQPRVVDLNAVVDDMSAMLRRLIGEDVTMEMVLAPDVGRVRVDPAQIEQVLVNLAVNARDAMPRGGRLRIETAIEREVYLRLTVADTGVGMDEDTRSRIFEPFFTTKEPSRGTGLGLATVYGIIRQSGGDIHVRSTPGQGATFEIDLPRVDAAPEPVAREARRDARARSGETVLVVEDEAPVRTVACAALERHGYRVLAARDAAEALRLAARHEGPIHLLLTDVVMPDLNGDALARCLVAARPAARVLFMSGYTPDAAALQGPALLAKPFTTSALLAAVRDALDARPPAPA